jgi:hypothetical protein
MNVILNPYGKEGGTVVAMPKSCFRGMDEETLAATAITSLLCNSSASKPNYLADCRSSSQQEVPAPSYKLGILSSLFECLTFSFEACGGIESLYGLMFLDKLVGADETAIVSCLQGIGNGQKNGVIPGYEPFRIAAALAVNGPHLEHGIPLLGMSIGKTPGRPDSLYPLLLDRVLDRCCLKASDLRWIVAHSLDLTATDPVSAILPNARMLWRDLHEEKNLGCADPFVTLACVARQDRERLRGLGIIFFAGVHGECGTLVVSA